MTIPATEIRYNDLLIAVLRRYRSGEAYGSLRERECGHWAYELVLDLPCIGCASMEHDDHFRQMTFDDLPEMH